MSTALVKPPPHVLHAIWRFHTTCHGVARLQGGRVVLRMQVSSPTPSSVISERPGTQAITYRCALPGRSSIPLPALTLRPPPRLQPRLSPATLRAGRQGDISRFLCVCSFCSTFVFLAVTFLPAFDFQSSPVAPASHCTLLADIGFPRAQPHPSINKRRVALLRLRLHLIGHLSPLQLPTSFLRPPHSCLSIPTTPTSPA